MVWEWCPDFVVPLAPHRPDLVVVPYAVTDVPYSPPLFSEAALYYTHKQVKCDGHSGIHTEGVVRSVVVMPLTPLDLHNH